MLKFGSGASTYRALYRAISSRGHRNRRPGGTSQVRRISPAIFGLRLNLLCLHFLSPFEAGAVNPDTMKDDSKFASNGNLSFLGSVAPGQLQPRFFLGHTIALCDAAKRSPLRKGKIAEDDYPTSILGLLYPSLLYCLRRGVSPR